MSASPSTSDDLEEICANCGKTGDKNDVKLKKCTGCFLLKYCGVNCQRAHRALHKKACQQQAAVLHEEKLFAAPPDPEECPVCLLRIPFEREDICYKPCCGKTICIGCATLMMTTNIADGFQSSRANATSSSPFAGIDLNKLLDHPCPFCRTNFSFKMEDHLIELHKRVELGDSKAMYFLAMSFLTAEGSAQPHAEIVRELLLNSASAGYPLANLSIGQFYYDGKYPSIFRKDPKNARKYFERAALGGDPNARALLAEIELDKLQIKTAYRHAMMAASAGHKGALDSIQDGYRSGAVSKMEYENTLRAYKKSYDEINSEERLKSKQQRASASPARNAQIDEMFNMLNNMRNR